MKLVSQKTVYIDNFSASKGIVEIFGMTGRSMHKSVFSETGITAIVTKLPTGAYLAMLTTEKGMETKHFFIP